MARAEEEKQLLKFKGLPAQLRLHRRHSVIGIKPKSEEALRNWRQVQRAAEEPAKAKLGLHEFAEQNRRNMAAVSLVADAVKNVEFNNKKAVLLQTVPIKRQDLQNLFNRVLPKSNELRSLVLEDVGMDHRSCRILANQLLCHKCKTLQTLRVVHNVIGDIGSAMLMHALTRQPYVAHILHLDLAANGIEIAGARSVAESLPSLSSLKTLNLSHNIIGDDGVRFVAEGLRSAVQPGQKGSALETLRLCKTGAADEGAKALAIMLTYNTVLQLLDLSLNSLTEVGTSHLETAVHCNGQQTILELSNKVSPPLSSLQQFTPSPPAMPPQLPTARRRTHRKSIDNSALWSNADAPLLAADADMAFLNPVDGMSDLVNHAMEANQTAIKPAGDSSPKFKGRRASLDLEVEREVCTNKMPDQQLVLNKHKVLPDILYTPRSADSDDSD